MPRRKYGHLIGSCPPTPKDKCRACRMGIPCTVHDQKEQVDYDRIRREKKIRYSGGKKGKRKTRKRKGSAGGG